jgi:hypothetical protein
MKAAKRKEGMILFVSVLILALMGALAIASLDTVNNERQSAGFQNRSNTAMFAAEAGVAAAVAAIEASHKAGSSCLPSLPFASVGSPVAVGDTSSWSIYGGPPRYYGFTDPSVPNSVTCVGLRSRNGGNMSVTATETIADWRINVVGVSSDGSRAHLEVMHELVFAGGSY